jgi:GT2 family glycosyltransferase
MIVFNHERWLATSLRRILASSLEPPPRILVVDSASTDGSVNVVKREFPDVEVIESKVNLGYAGGANLGLQLTTEEIVFLINPDVTVRETTLAALDEALRADERVGMVGCKLLYPDGCVIQHAGGMISYPLALAQHIGYGEPDSDEFGSIREVDYVTGALCAVKRSVLAQVGQFDEGFYPAYFEETDLCQRIRHAGYKVVYVPSAVAIHAESVTTGKNTVEYYHFYHRNRLRLVLKHYSAAQLWQDFLDAETKRLRDLGDSHEVGALRQAYQDNLDLINGWASFPANPRNAAPLPGDGNRAHLLWILRSLADHQLQGVHPSGGMKFANDRDRHGLIERLRQKQTLVESPFTSSTPLIGPLVVRLRAMWNWMSTTWYVRPLTHQQNEFNAELVETFDAVSNDLAKLDLASRLTIDSTIATEQLLTRLHRDVARLEARLRQLEASDDVNHAIDVPPGRSLPRGE